MSTKTILLLQSILIFLQMANAAFNKFPEPWPVLLAAFVGAFQFFVNHLGNQADPGKSGGNTMARILAGPLILFTLGVSNLQAQTSDEQLPSQLVAVGMGYNQDASPALFGWGVYACHLTGSLYSYSGYDITPLPGETVQVLGHSVPKVKFTQYTGLSMRAVQINKLTMWLLGTGGIAANGEVLAVSWGLGGLAHYPLGRGWGAVLGVQMAKDPISGTQYIPRVGVSYGGK